MDSGKEEKEKMLISLSLASSICTLSLVPILLECGIILTEGNMDVEWN